MLEYLTIFGSIYVELTEPAGASKVRPATTTMLFCIFQPRMGRKIPKGHNSIWLSVLMFPTFSNYSISVSYGIEGTEHAYTYGSMGE